MLENLDKVMHLRFNFDACPMHSPFRLVHFTHHNLSAGALFCLNSLAKVNKQLIGCNNYIIGIIYIPYQLKQAMSNVVHAELQVTQKASLI